MIKVLHINRNYISNAIHQTMVEKLENEEIVNDVFVPIGKNKNSKDFAVVVNDNVIVEKCFNRIDSLFFTIKQHKIKKVLLRNFAPEKYDLIHAYTLFTDGNIAMELFERFGIPYVVAVRNTDVNDFLKKMIHLRKLGIKIMQKASAIFFLSEEYKKQVFDKYIPNDCKQEFLIKTHVIPNGIDDFWFENVPEKRSVRIDREIKALYIGHVNKNKNIITTQKALTILREKGYDISFDFIGKIDDKDEFDRIIGFPYTVYHEAQPKELLIDAYRKSDIFIMPSLTETFGVVYAEAISQNVPVVYSRGQGFDGQFPEGTVGYSAFATSAESVAEAIEKVIVEYQNIQMNLIKASEKFRWCSIIHHYKELYIKILGPTNNR